MNGDIPITSLSYKSRQNEDDEVKPIQGTCLTMCPNNELRLRQRENLHHLLESKVNRDGQRIGYSDPKRMVKAFSRSAAGCQINACDVRPLPILRRTVAYLLSVVCSSEDVSWRERYDFVSDRLRAVRQDITVQRLRGSEVIEILASAARFHSYSHYRLCEYETSEFDPTLNIQQLNEILLTIISIYKESAYTIDTRTLDYQSKSKESLNTHDTENVTEPSVEVDLATSALSELNLGKADVTSPPNDLAASPKTDQDANCRGSPTEDATGLSTSAAFPYSNIRCIPRCNSGDNISDPPLNTCKNSNIDSYTVMEEVLSLFILLHIGKPEIIYYILEMPKKVRESRLVSRSVDVSLNWMSGNHIPLIRLFFDVTPVIATAIHLHLNKIQRHALGVLSVGHSSKVLHYPTEELRRYLLFPSLESVLKVCQYYGLETTAEGVQFVKINFKWDVPVHKPEKGEWLDAKLKEFSIPELLMGQCMM